MTSIEWTRGDDGEDGKTWNPFRGCKKISPGCKHCYAETFAERFRGVKGHPYEQGFDPRFVPGALAKPLTWKKPTRIFVNSMSDLFLEDFTNEQIAAVFGVMAACPQHTFQVLTKRGARMREWFKWAERRGEHGTALFPDDPLDWRIRQMLHVEARRAGADLNQKKHQNHGGPWPLPNVHLGVSVESQVYAHERIPLLLETPAALHFLSCEPLLGRLNLKPYLERGLLCECDPTLPQRDRCERTGRRRMLRCNLALRRVRWVIIGGESGPGSRPFDVRWAEDLVEQCKAADVPAFVKQLGANAHDSMRSIVGGWQPGDPEPNTRLSLKHKKGGDISEWPPELRVREFPEPVANS